MTKRATLVSAMLLAGLVVAVISATAALRLIGGGAFGPGGPPLTPAQVQRSLAQPVAAPQPGKTPAAGATQHPTAPPGRAPAPKTGNFTSAGGTVYASCQSGQVRLVSWIPAQGYQTDSYATGPAASAWVTFKSSGSEVDVTVACAGGRPRFATPADDQGGGGGEKHGGGGDGGPGPSRGGS